MATFLDILLLALIVAPIGNLISNFKGKKTGLPKHELLQKPCLFFRISSCDSAFLSTLTIFAVQKRSRDKSRLL